MAAGLFIAGFIAVVVVTVVNLAASTGANGCKLAAPVPSLSPALAALGGFDQPYDPSDTATLDSLATNAAAATSQNLIGATPATPVQEHAISASQPNAIVIPLLYPASSTHPGRLAGLVSFLRDCAGRAYFSQVWDLTSNNGAFASFPAVSEQQAAQSLGTSTPELGYSNSPMAPLWYNPATGDSIPAGPVYPA